MIAADHNLDPRKQLLDQSCQSCTGSVLPRHGRQAHEVRPDLGESPGQVAPDVSPFSDQIDEIDLVLSVDVAAHARDPVVRHVNRGLMDHDGCHVGHGYQYDSHEARLSVQFSSGRLVTKVASNTEALFSTALRKPPRRDRPF